MEVRLRSQFFLIKIEIWGTLMFMPAIVWTRQACRLVPQYEQHHDNIIYLPGQPGDVLHPFRVLWKGVVIMSTYEEFMTLLTMGLLIVAILNLKNKK